jgi:hypothetical protein
MAPETIAESTVVGRVLYGGESNPYYKEPEKRRVVVRITRNIEGLYRVTAVTIFGARYCYGSRLFTTEGEARADANRVRLFATFTFHGQMRDDEGSRIEGDEEHSLCPTCNRYDTLTTRQLAWGDETTCSACDYNHYYSIGD